MKKHRSFFEVYDKIKFSDNDPNLSRNIDAVLYGKKPEKEKNLRSLLQK